LARAYLREAPTEQDWVLALLKSVGATLETTPSLRFVLSWETDASDVDLYVSDRDGAYANWANPQLASGGELLANVTTGYGPEAFVIRRSEFARPYSLRVQYRAAGAMGYGLGTLQIIEHDGSGRLTVQARPFVLMRENAVVDLGKY
jgi:uncharacterized protein YfaP (DUF2135 family)